MNYFSRQLYVLLTIICFATVGCSTSTTQDSSESITTIEDTSVATATVDTEPDPVPEMVEEDEVPVNDAATCLLYTSPSPRDTG